VQDKKFSKQILMNICRCYLSEFPNFAYICGMLSAKTHHHFHHSRKASDVSGDMFLQVVL